MKYLKIKDIANRNRFKYKELNNIASRFMFFYSALLKPSLSASRNFFFSKRRINRFSKTKIVRRCVFTNRGRGSLRPYSISRSLLRECLLFGLVPGYKKAVW